MRLVGLQYLDVTLSAQVVDLGGLDLVDDLHQTRAVGQITVVQLHVLKKRQTKKRRHVVSSQVFDRPRRFSLSSK